MDPAGQFDLANNSLIISYATASPVSQIHTFLVTGFNSGAWNGNGINSSTAAADSNNFTALGYGDAAALNYTIFSGQPITGDAVLVKYTYYGDSNLDGLVNGADFRMFLDGLATGGSSWTQGYYTYDGKVDLGNDFDLFLVGYLHNGGALGALAPIIIEDTQLSAAQKAQLLAVVPEPMGIVSIDRICRSRT